METNLSHKNYPLTLFYNHPFVKILVHIKRSKNICNFYCNNKFNFRNDHGDIIKDETKSLI